MQTLTNRLHCTYSTVSVKAGIYFLGDPCYAVPGDLWSELLLSCGSFLEYPVGEVTSQRGEFEVLSFGTGGDGVFSDTLGCTYPVDSGMIGLTPGELAQCGNNTLDWPPRMDLGRFVSFADDFTCSVEDGVLTFGDIVIDTNN